jgi:hypothetical protein
MRKLKLAVEELVVESFDPREEEEGRNGTVHAHATDAGPCTIYEACTRVDSCPAELCWPQQTNDPRQRLCVTPYVECGTQGWTCDYCGGNPLTAFC